MAAQNLPSARFRRIGLELRRLRLEAGMTMKEAGAFLDRSSSSISLLEAGTQAIRPRDLDYILMKYGHAEGPFREAMLELAREGRKKGWWHRYAHALSPELMDFLSLETDARSISTYQTVLVPGLLQTPDYARALLDPDSTSALRDALEVRMARQTLLDTSSPPRLTAILDEAVLRRQVGGAAVMRDQLARLRDLSEREHLDIRITPFEAGAHRGLNGPFTILELGVRGRLTIVTLESLQGMSYVENTKDVHRYETVFDELTRSALSKADSRDLLERLRSES
ncbi:helix-turn-helix transcriptional regulator [Actinomadura viridis]|uniref:Transcriptional regulator with XRE-family HTH domain n=1 Tax=Actinomadura viridis TaxID=58110 RepID=A0A931GH76_9ACTN|nr:helix-turn-helix transcriptional regulator [Actinomadura viridis]MBG6086552.1 transcriptional regulator with XRE-family HTH domain [Actinomadura viridis]